MASGSASGSTRPASLPPSSSVSRFMVSAEAAMIARPALAEPVNEILSMPACVVIAAPRSSPPARTWSTPGGRTSWASSPRRRVETGVYGDGLTITGFPATSAGPIFHSDSISG